MRRVPDFEEVQEFVYREGLSGGSGELWREAKGLLRRAASERTKAGRLLGEGADVDTKLLSP